MAHTVDKIAIGANAIWFLDSRFSNHMLGTKQLFKELDEKVKSTLRLGDDNVIQVEGKCTIDINTRNGKTKLLNNE